MTDNMIAYCGIICTNCPQYIATRANDRAALERIAAQRRTEMNVTNITAECVACDGCLSDGGRLASYCWNCWIRACARERGVVNCAHCPDYACELLERFWNRLSDHGKGLRCRLDEVRHNLNSA
jgi:hypothetical protein